MTKAARFLETRERETTLRRDVARTTRRLAARFASARSRRVWTFIDARPSGPRDPADREQRDERGREPEVRAHVHGGEHAMIAAMLVTEPIPSESAARAEHLRSDDLRFSTLPPGEPIVPLYAALEAALANGRSPAVRVASNALVTQIAHFYDAGAPPVKVLGSRPLDSREGTELFGDYDLELGFIRVWMRTAVRGKVTATGTFVATLLHELCHHLDVAVLGLPGTPHTRGFYERTDALYHLVRATPTERRRPLVWVRSGNRWRIDWTAARKGKTA